MRRASVVAPLLLIGIGALFLVRNLYPDLPLIDYLARYWPFLLIAWGMLRLAEILFWAATEKPYPRAGVSGGEWVLVVFLCIFGASLHTVRGLSTWWPRTGMTIGGLDMFGETFEYPVAAEKPASKNARVVIESFRGNARVTGADVQTVKVTGRQTIRSLNQTSADRAHQSAAFELGGDEAQTLIRTNQDRASGELRVSAELEITVPKGSTIEAHGRGGDFDITDIDGSVEITSDNAGVRLQNIGGEARIDLRRSDIVRASSVKGNFELKGRGADIDLQNIDGQVTIAGTYTGLVQFHNIGKPMHFTGTAGTELNIEKLPGQVRMALGDFSASDLVGPIRLTLRSRDVRLGSFTNSLDVNVDRGDIELRPEKLPLSRMNAHTRSGDITLALPAGGKFDLSATTTRGDITNDFGDPLRLDNSGRGASLRGSAGGGPTISLNVDRGQIVVRKATASEAPMTTREDEPKKPGTPHLPELKKIEQ